MVIWLVNDVDCDSYGMMWLVDDVGCDSYGMRYMAKTMHMALRAHYPSAAEKDILKVSLSVQLL